MCIWIINEYQTLLSCLEHKQNWLLWILKIWRVKPRRAELSIHCMNAKSAIAISGRWMGMDLIRLSFAGLHIAQPAGFVRIPRGVVMVGAGSGSLVPSQRVERSGDSLEVNLVAAAAAAAFTNKSRGAASRGFAFRRRPSREHLHSGRRGARTFWERDLLAERVLSAECACVSDMVPSARPAD